MAFKQSSSSFHKILILVFGVAFGLVALALGYQAMNTSADIRSKAAENQSIYQQWEFNGTNTEGWVSENSYTARTQNGYLTLAIQKFSRLAVLRNFQVNTKIPKGLKTIAFSMAVGDIPPVTPTLLPTSTPTPTPTPSIIKRSTPTPPPPTKGPTPPRTGFGGYVQGVTDETDDAALAKTAGACSLEARLCPDGSYVGRSGARCEFIPCSPIPTRDPRPTGRPPEIKFTALLYYKLANKTTFEKPLFFGGLRSGKFQEYKINLPDGGDIAIERLRIVFTSGVTPGDVVSVDWVRLLGPVLKPTPFPTPPPTTPTVMPTPTPTACYTGVKSVVLQKEYACTAGSALGISYTCWDGSNGFYGVGGITCYTKDVLYRRAESACLNKSNCTPTGTGGPTKYPTPTRGPTPPYPTLTQGTPTPTPSEPTSVQSTPTPTPSQQMSCNVFCTTNNDCVSGLVCVNNACRNPSCTEASSCVCQ